MYSFDDDEGVMYRRDDSGLGRRRGRGGEKGRIGGNATEDEIDGTATATFCVGGMSCAICAGGIERLLLSAIGGGRIVGGGTTRVLSASVLNFGGSSGRYTAMTF